MSLRPALLAALLARAAHGQSLPEILNSLAAHAERFRTIAPSAIAEETLEQRTRPFPNAPFLTREVVSEYGFFSLHNAPNALHEVRKVVSVDGRQVLTLEKARQAMTLGLTSADDKLKKRLLEDLERHGLHGAATDFGQVILLFSARHIADYEFTLNGERQIGADRIVIVAFKQKSGDTGVTVFLGNTAKREPLHGEISIRLKDLLPLRITMTSAQTVRESAIREESTVEYRMDAPNALLPISVVHREYVDNVLLSENQYTYGAFRKLTAGER